VVFHVAYMSAGYLLDTVIVEPWQALEFFHFANVARSQR